ncbi:hypothetical protein DOY81_011712 [Sarcophaga bullata]|nr:hypothetical protein DOY81_011712 [Sarcophaga bullata]
MKNKVLQLMDTINECPSLDGWLIVVIETEINKRAVPAHRLVLSASSAYFSAMFTGSLRETKERRK